MMITPLNIWKCNKTANYTTIRRQLVYNNITPTLQTIDQHTHKKK